MILRNNEGEILYKDNSKTIKQTFQNAMDKKMDLSGIKLEFADLSNMQFRGLILNKSIFRHVDFNGSTFVDCAFNLCNIGNICSFEKTQWMNCEFRDMYLCDTSRQYEYAIFLDCKWYHSDLMGNYASAKFIRCVFESCYTRYGSNFRDAFFSNNKGKLKISGESPVDLTFTEFDNPHIFDYNSDFQILGKRLGMAQIYSWFYSSSAIPPVIISNTIVKIGHQAWAMEDWKKMTREQYRVFGLDLPGFPMSEMLRTNKYLIKERAKKEKEEKKNV